MTGENEKWSNTRFQDFGEIVWQTAAGERINVAPSLQKAKNKYPFEVDFFKTVLLIHREAAEAKTKDNYLKHTTTTQGNLEEKEITIGLRKPTETVKGIVPANELRGFLGREKSFHAGRVVCR